MTPRARAAAACVAGGAVFLLAAAVATRRSTRVTGRALGAGYLNGKPVAVELASISSGKMMRVDAAAAFDRMEAAARSAGHELRPTRAFATMAEQRRLYAAYLGAQAKKGASSAAGAYRELTAAATAAELEQLAQAYAAANGNLAARPGYSNHQQGLAVDIEVGGTSSPVYRWLEANAARWGFRRTVPSEPWHWEYRLGAP